MLQPAEMWPYAILLCSMIQFVQLRLNTIYISIDLVHVHVQSTYGFFFTDWGVYQCYLLSYRNNNIAPFHAPIYFGTPQMKTKIEESKLSTVQTVYVREVH